MRNRTPPLIQPAQPTCVGLAVEMGKTWLSSATSSTTACPAIAAWSLRPRSSNSLSMAANASEPDAHPGPGICGAAVGRLAANRSAAAQPIGASPSSSRANSACLASGSSGGRRMYAAYSAPVIIGSPIVLRSWLHAANDSGLFSDRCLLYTSDAADEL